MREINYFKLFVSLFLALLLSSLSLRLIEYRWEQYQAGIALEVLKTQQAKHRQTQTVQRKKQAQRVSAQQTNQEICTYWQQVYQQNASEKHLRYRDNACQRATHN